VTAGAAALGAGATRARSAAGNGFQRAVWRLQDVLPRRRPGVRRVTGTTSRMETQRRAAVALLAFVAVAATLGLGVYAFGGQRQPGEAVKSITVAQRAFEAAEAALALVTGPGIDLIEDAPDRALTLLQTAYRELDTAEDAGYPVAQIRPLRDEALAGLDRLYGVVPIRSTTLFTFPADAGDVSLAAMVRGSDGAPYVLDTGTMTVWRIDRAKRTASAVARSGQRASRTRVADPKFIATGGPDVLILDVKNVLWRWRPANANGKGTLVRIPVKESASWGNDIRTIGTFVANFDAAFYKLYIVDPSEQNIMVLDPANDGSGYPVNPTRRLPTDRPVDGITDLLIDGDIFVAEDGAVARVIPASGWRATLPEDTLLRPESEYVLLSSPDKPDGSPSRRDGPLYAYDSVNQRIVAFGKASGDYVAQYRLAGGDDAWRGLRDMLVLPATDATAAPTLWWISSTGLHAASLEAVPDEPAPSPSASASASPEATPAPSPTKKPRRTPKP
jgi:hypothetical protein